MFVSVCCDKEKCFCGKSACAKVEEVIFVDDPFSNRHPLTSYICEEHFNMIFSEESVESVEVFRKLFFKNKDLSFR